MNTNDWSHLRTQQALVIECERCSDFAVDWGRQPNDMTVDFFRRGWRMGDRFGDGTLIQQLCPDCAGRRDE